MTAIPNTISQLLLTKSKYHLLNSYNKVVRMVPNLFSINIVTNMAFYLNLGWRGGTEKIVNLNTLRGNYSWKFWLPR